MRVGTGRFLAGPVSGLLALGLVASPLHADAQGTGRVPRIGVLCPWRCPTPPRERPSPPLSEINPDNLMADEAFRLGLRDLGYLEGQTIVIEWRSAMGHYDRLPDLAADLVRLKIDVLVTVGAPWLRAFAQANRAVPIVLAQVADPVMGGLVTSLARPGGNITGLSLPSHELEGKQLELLKEVVPGLSRVAVLYNPDNPASRPHLRETEGVARALGIELHFVPFRGPADVEAAFSAIREGRAGALLLHPDFVILTHQVRLVEFARKSRLPTISEFRDLVELGGLMTYGPNANDMFRRAAAYVDKILKGAKPGDLPMEQPMRFELVVNLGVAKALGLMIPQSIRIRADREIQ